MDIKNYWVNRRASREMMKVLAVLVTQYPNHVALAHNAILDALIDVDWVDEQCKAGVCTYAVTVLGLDGFKHMISKFRF